MPKRKVKNTWGIVILLTIGLGSAAFLTSCGSSSKKVIQGSGSTAVAPFMIRWAKGYTLHSRGKYVVSYNAQGSGAGQADITNGIVAFAVSDQPFTLRQLQKLRAVQFPIDVSIVAIATRGVPTLTLDGATLARIFMGAIVRWNDPAIQKLNPQIKLPSKPILVIHRSDGSGTTYNFANYLSHISPIWKRKMGVDKLLSWPAHTIGAKGNEGVAAQLQKTDGAIAYLDYAYIMHASYGIVRLMNRSGRIVSPTLHSMRKAARTIDWKKAEKAKFSYVPTNPSGKRAWPIPMLSFVILRKNVRGAKAAWRFVRWAMSHNVSFFPNFGYVPIPEKILHKTLIPYVQSYMVH